MTISEKPEIAWSNWRKGARAEQDQPAVPFLSQLDVGTTPKCLTSAWDHTRREYQIDTCIDTAQPNSECSQSQPTRMTYHAGLWLMATCGSPVQTPIRIFRSIKSKIAFQRISSLGWPRTKSIPYGHFSMRAEHWSSLPHFRYSHASLVLPLLNRPTDMIGEPTL
jgi:hypothetical protein